MYQPKLWNELQAGVECLTQFVLVLEAMTAAPPRVPEDPFAPNDAERSDEDDVADAARLLQQQIVYNGEVLDISFEAMRTYKEGTQSLAYLDASVYLAYALLRMMERWSKRKGGDNMYVRKKKKPKKKGQYGRDRAIAPMLICAHCGQGGRCLREKACLTSKRKSLRTRRKKR